MPNEQGFAKAETQCQRYHGEHLAAIHDSFVNTVISQKASKYFDGGITDFWLGGNNLNSENTWAWTDGSIFDFSDWARGQPSNRTGHNCVSLSMNNGYWSSQDCSKFKPYVCLISSGSASATTTT
uniref:C-type lectin domain-containing protein n=1 Tax=Panagrolaimus sp. ES5 TaxID=591445 RepID=A0AC34GRC0_9BILA